MSEESILKEGDTLSLGRHDPSRQNKKFLTSSGKDGDFET